jgi:putative phosphoesterase
MELTIVADSHIPSRASRIPESFRERIGAADHVLHAGDFDSERALEETREIAPEITAVSGNMDPRLGLPSVATVELGGVTFVLTHGTGSPQGYEQRVASVAREHADVPDPVAVAGHTHELLDTTHDGVRVLNPGSVTGAPPASRTTMLTATVADGDLTVEAHER